MTEHPHTIEYEIDRKALTTYWRVRGLLACLMIFGGFGLFTGLVSGGKVIDEVELTAAMQGLSIMAHYVFRDGIIGSAIALLIYALLVHFQAALAARKMRLIVEGPYLRLITGCFFARDRRIHFRAISDYITIDSPLLRPFGITILLFHVIGVTPNGATAVPGIVDAGRVRDELCEIDADRELG